MVEFQGRELNLTTKGIRKLEAKLHTNPLNILLRTQSSGEVPAMGDILTVLQYAIGDITEDGTAKLYDEWLEDGHAFGDIVEVIVQLFQDCGLLAKTEETNPN